MTSAAPQPPNSTVALEYAPQHQQRGWYIRRPRTMLLVALLLAGAIAWPVYRWWVRTRPWSVPSGFMSGPDHAMWVDGGTPGLRGLFTGGGHITARGLQATVQPNSSFASTVIELKMSWCGIDDNGLAILATHGSMPALTTLNLRGNDNITDAGLQHLCGWWSGMANLRNLNLRGTKVTPAGVAALRKARPKLAVVLTDWAPTCPGPSPFHNEP